MPIRHGKAIWPGALSVISCTYTNSHGIYPGYAELTINEQDSDFAEVGNLIITDGVGEVVIPDCKVDRASVNNDLSGRTWTLSIFDRRWKWQNLGQVSGCYNQLDDHGKLIPWTIRSPYELAVLCLEAMGEKNYIIDLPYGLTKLDGVMHGQLNPPHIGVVPTTGTNPPINWVQEPPAQALANLAEQFGRRVVYRLGTNSVAVWKPGFGAALPDGSIAHESPAINSPETPTGVAVVGGPTKYQAKVLLEPVGEEWDGSVKPINQLSYRPLPTAGKVQIDKCVGSDGGSNNTYQVFIGARVDGNPYEQPTTGALFETTASYPYTAVATLRDLINASNDPRVRNVVVATSSGAELTITGQIEGKAYCVWCQLSGTITPPASFVPQLVQAAESPTDGWSMSKPGEFINVRATAQLTYHQARAKAEKSVYKWYRITTIAPRGEGPLVIPGYGPIQRRQQLIPLDTQVEQVVPEPLNPNIVNPNLANIENNAIANLAAAVPINFYDGYSRDKPAAMFGSHNVSIAIEQSIFWVPLTPAPGGVPGNTPRGAQIFVPFKINAQSLCVEFSTYVYRVFGWGTTGARYYPIERPVLLTGFHIRNAETNSLEVSYLAEYLPGMKGSTNFAFYHHPDIELFLIGKYNADGSTNGAVTLELDAQERARHYLDGHKLQFLLEGGLSRTYNGIEFIDCDGAIMQVSWSVGPDDAGAMTTASRNTEHSVYVPPYPARRRAEFLAAQAAIGNGGPGNQNLGGSLYTPNGEGVG